VDVAKAPGAAEAVRAATLVPRLGVGVLYNPALPEYLRTRRETYDYVEVIPEMFWTDRGPGARPRFVELEGWIAMLEWIASKCPVVGHNIGLSLGSADWFDDEYPEHIQDWNRRYRFAWHSDHLSFVRITTAEGHDHNAGLAVPVSYDHEVLDMVIERIEHVQRTVSAPFLLENSVAFINVPDQDMSEPEFLNAVAARTGCGLLLDVHNVYVNARNHGFDALDFVAALDLAHVGEIHIAGGSEIAGMYTDSHAGPCPEPVWNLLEWVVPRAPNLGGITFEFHDSYYPLLREDGIAAELSHARDIWEHRGVAT
jgi:uncharacterized protein (UPF0276 family)